ncbi:hypothetical protein AVEN_233146-1, partial [Araneus ventricosus]
MTFGLVNAIDTPYGQYAYNYSHPRKPLCSVSYEHIARGSGQLNGSKDRCEVNLPRYTLPSTYTHSTNRESFGFQARR